MLMRLSIVCSVVAVLLAAAPASADNAQWGFVKSDGDARLFYGVPESEDVTLSLICEPQRKRITIVSAVLPPKAGPKRSGKIRLSNGSSSLEYAGKTVRDRRYGVSYFTALIAVDARLLDLLETGTSLLIESLGARESVPLDGVREPLGRMRQACR